MSYAKSACLSIEPKDLAFGVVDPEVNFDLAKCDMPYNKCDTSTLSCRFIKTLPNNIIRPVSYHVWFLQGKIHNKNCTMIFSFR